MPGLKLLPTERTIEARAGEALLEVLLGANIRIQMSCGGNGMCATCHVRIRAGMDQLSPRTARERRTLALVADANATSRLACQCEILGEGIVLELSRDMYVEKVAELVSLIGQRAPEDIRHPIRGHLLVPRGKIITRSMLEQSTELDREVSALQNSPGAGPRGRPKSEPAEERLSPARNTPAAGQTPAQPTAPTVADRTIPDTPHLETGRLLGKYLLMECVGRGGSGHVYRAQHTTLNLAVAIKFLQLDPNAPPSEFLSAFRTEATLLAKLNHRHVIKIYDFEDSLPQPRVVMEYVNGPTLAQLLDQSGRIRPDRAMRLIDQVIAGLEAASQLGIIHRDIKPANILVSLEGGAKIVDFGLARRVDRRPGSPAANRGPEGTLAYMSPEQIDGLPDVDHRTDIYSLGITLFQLLTGRLPFEGRSHHELMLKQISQELPSVHDLVGDLPQGFDTVIRQMTAKNAADRPQSYAALRKLIREQLTEEARQ